MYIFTERINNDRYILFFALSRRFVDAPIFPPIIYLYSCSPYHRYVDILFTHCFCVVVDFMITLPDVDSMHFCYFLHYL